MNPLRTGAGFAALVLAGLIALVFTWYGVSGTANVADQVPYAISGGIGGLAMVAAGCGLLAAHIRRYGEGREDAALDRVLATASVLADAGLTAALPITTTTGAAAPARGTRRAAGTRRLRSVDPELDSEEGKVQ